MKTPRWIVASSLTVALLSGCIQETGAENCKGPGPGSPGSGVDLQINDLSTTVEGSLVVFRINYWNAGDADATPLSEGGIQMGIYLDRTECPPAGEAPDYILALPPVIPPEATAEVGLSIPETDLVAGDHNAYARVDPTNETWEADETNNCYGPSDFTSN